LCRRRFRRSGHLFGSRGFGIILDFIRKELSADASELNGHEEELLSNIRGKLADLTAFVDAREESIAAALSEAYAVLPCPACQQNALTVDDGVECLFCGYKASADTAADDYVRNVLGLDRFRLAKDGGECPIGFCPDCDWLACVHAKLDGYLCFGCGAQWQVGDLAKCGRCGRLIDSEKNDIPVCDSCFYEVTGRDD
jgi:hypothetical protein